MRPGQNKRMRGRPNNNRRGPNPLTRSYESNGPDVKIRGNAHHVAEKYLQLARDAHTSSDPVAAENYLQHAEHYFRLIASAQAAQLQQQNGTARPLGEGEDDMDDDDDVGGLSDRFASPVERAPAPFQPQPGFTPPVQAQPQPQSQPYQERPPYENDRQPQGDRGGYQGRPERANNRPQDRGPRDNRPYQERQEGPRDNRDSRDNRFPRDNRPREFRPYREPNPPREIANPAEAAPAPVLPSFITAPPRVNAAPDVEEAQFSSPVNHSDPAPQAETQTQAVDAAPLENGEAAPRFPARGRRRRLRPNFGFDSPGETQAAESPEPPPHKDEAPAGE
jgi:hypothetical protein